MESKEKRFPQILSLLKKHYPDTRIALHYHNSFQLLVATILSAQCTDEVVNRVTPGLFQKYASPGALGKAQLEEVEALIKSTGFFRNKAKNLVAMSKALTGRFGGEVPKRMEDLITLPGVARKTANVVLGSAFGISEGVVVDTHVKRLAFRLGLTKQSDPIKIERDLMALLPKEEWHAFSIRMIFHGRRICEAKKPKCRICPLADLCPKKGIAAD
ncbi:endonuclease III [candidate division FCPU426 bacterium]|nr:endonuclease III [candidate division FCPU426 bacterium]